MGESTRNNTRNNTRSNTRKITRNEHEKKLPLHFFEWLEPLGRNWVTLNNNWQGR